ncbi:hypothetical protein V1478_013929, partial [Vespula squamosa]
MATVKFSPAQTDTSQTRRPPCHCVCIIMLIATEVVTIRQPRFSRRLEKEHIAEQILTEQIVKFRFSFGKEQKKEMEMEIVGRGSGKGGDGGGVEEVPQYLHFNKRDITNVHLHHTLVDRTTVPRSFHGLAVRVVIDRDRESPVLIERLYD